MILVWGSTHDLQSVVHKCVYFSEITTKYIFFSISRYIGQAGRYRYVKKYQISSDTDVNADILCITNVLFVRRDVAPAQYCLHTKQHGDSNDSLVIITLVIFWESNRPVDIHLQNTRFCPTSLCRLRFHMSHS